MISEIDLKDWEPVTARRILTDIEFNHVYNGRQSPFSKEEMDFLMKFVSTAEKVRKSFVPQVASLLKPMVWEENQVVEPKWGVTVEGIDKLSFSGEAQ